MPMHQAAEQYPPAPYERGNDVEDRTGTVFAVSMRNVGKHEVYADEPFMEELAGLDMFNGIRAAPPDPTGKAVAVRSDNDSCSCNDSNDSYSCCRVLGS